MDAAGAEIRLLAAQGRVVHQLQHAIESALVRQLLEGEAGRLVQG